MLHIFTREDNHLILFLIDETSHSIIKGILDQVLVLVNSQRLQLRIQAFNAVQCAVAVEYVLVDDDLDLH